jgi:hypothetical protein
LKTASPNRYTFAVKQSVMKTKNFKYLSLLGTALFLIALTSKAEAQGDPEDEYIKADALAMAYITCDQALAKYYYNLDPKNTSLAQDLRELSLVKGQMTINMEIKYRDDERLKQKYEREIEPAKKKLGKCIKYKSIMESNEKSDKEKETENK